MIDLKVTLAQWEEDSKIDKFKLDDCSIKSASLHAKYLEVFAEARMLQKETEAKFSELKKNKWLWFNGKMSKVQMDELGWAYDPFGGLCKPLKSDLEIFFDSDKDVVKLKARMDYINMCLEVLKEILDTIKWRHTHIKNTIDFLRFTSGT